MRTDEILIDAPCDVPWESMRGDDRRRFCSQCDKQVHDLSAMTREEAAAVVGDGHCVRYRSDADGNLLFRQPRRRRRDRIRRIRRIRRVLTGGIAALGLAGGPAFAADGPETPVESDDFEDGCGILPMTASASAAGSTSVTSASTSADRSWLDRVWSWFAGEEEAPSEPGTPPAPVETRVVPVQPQPEPMPVVQGQMAYHPPTAQSPVQISGAGQATRLEVSCPSGFRARTVVNKGSGAIPQVPEGETCTATVKGVPATFAVHAGQHCSPDSGGAWTCR